MAPAKNALATMILLGAVTCGCHTTQHPASPTTSTTKAPPATTQSVAAPVNIQPLPVRKVQKSQPTSPDKCPAANPNAPAARDKVLTACDLARTPSIRWARRRCGSG